MPDAVFMHVRIMKSDRAVGMQAAMDISTHVCHLNEGKIGLKLDIFVI